MEEAEYLGLVLEAAPIAIVVVDDSGRISLVNRQVEELFGYAREELLGQPVEVLVPPRFHGGHPAQRSSYLAAPSARPMGAGRDLFARRKDGTEIPVEIGLNPIRTPQGGSFVLATVIDITERKHAEELRLQSVRERRRRLDVEADLERALDASHVKSQFVATMSHELRTPLNAIIGMAELLAGTQLDHRQRTFAQTINESAEALLAIINSILDFSKIEAGKIELETRDFELETIVEGAVEVLAQQMRQKGLQIYTFVDPAIPRVLCGDGDRLRQILLNLVGNAVKFTQRGHIMVRALPILTFARHVVVRFEVEDTGAGIAPQVLPRLFEPFVQGDSSSSRRFGGTGLGLSISKRLVGLMDGEIGVESEPEQGALFWFTARFGRPAVDAPSRRLSGVGAFIVSDDDRYAKIVERYLAAWGVAHHRVRSEADVAAAAGGASREGIVDWVLLIDADARDSESLRATLRAIEAVGEVHVIPVGADERLSKPVRRAQLFQTIVGAVEEEERGNGGIAPARLGVPLPPAGKPAVLVAEDNATIQELLVHQFAQLGVTARIVSDGAEAVAAIRNEPYACVFMDCHMPDVDGFEATRLIREEEAATGRHVPIIAMTANAFKEDREACLAAGMDDYLSKPVRIKDLRSMIERWLAPAPAP